MRALDGSAEVAVAAIGVNCTAPQPAAHHGAGGYGAGFTAKPVIVYPNRGEQYDAVTKQWLEALGRDRSPFAQQAMAWAQAGLIEGCCRTTPEDIRALRERRASQRNRSVSPKAQEG